MEKKFFDTNNYLQQTKELLNLIRKKVGLQAFVFSRKMLLAAWYAGIKPDTEYIPYYEVLNRTKQLLQRNENVTLAQIKQINYCYDTHGLFFGVNRKTILEGSLNDVIIEAQEYYNTPIDLPLDDEEEEIDAVEEEDDDFEMFEE